MKKLRTRLVFDALLTVLLVFEMLFQVTGDVLHEVVGVAFFASIVAHLVFARKWIGAMTKSVSAGKRMKPAAVVRMVLGMMLAATMVVLMASSIAISNLLANVGVDLAGSAYATWATVHSASAYALCCLVVAHLAVHWASIASAFKIPYNPQRRAAINSSVTALGLLGMAAIGMVGYRSIAGSVGSTVATSDSNPAGSANEQFSQISDAPQSADAAQESASGEDAASGQVAQGTRSGKGKRSRSGEAANAQATPNTSSGEGDVTGQDAAPEQGSSGPGTTSGTTSNSGTGSSANSGTATGTCTLCRKNCSLSAPKCNKPYEAGLI